MSIIRTRLPFEDRYTQVPNAWLRDARLSWRARGILAGILTHREGWEVTAESIIDGGVEGRDAVRTAIRELVDAGYLRLIRDRGKDGRLRGSVYETTAPGDGFPGHRETASTVADSQASGATRGKGPSPQVAPDDWKPVAKEDQEEHQEEDMSAKTADAPSRNDVEQICTAVADHAESQIGKRPTVTKKWRDSARLLIDRDGFSLEQAMLIIRWVNSHDFWAANILSAPKLREKFPNLVAQSRRDSAPKLDKAAQMILNDRQRRQAAESEAMKEIAS